MIQDAVVSIIVPFYNQSEYIEECLNSVIAQTYPQWECIIVNDGSPDDPDSLVQCFLDKDRRFKYIKKENGGLSSARNAGITISKGKYILPLDADDKIGPNYCEEGIKVLESNENVKVVYAEAELFGVRKGIWELKPYSIYNLSCENVIYCSGFFKKTDYDNAGGYNEKLKHGWEDWDFWISILKNGGIVIKLPDVHFYYRTKLDSMIIKLSQNNNARIETMNIIYDKNKEFFIKHHGNPIAVIQREEALKAHIKLLKKNFNDSRKYKLGNILLSPYNFAKKLVTKIF